MKISDWINETRPAFLLLTPITFSVGLAIAFTEGHFYPVRALLGLIGTVLAHASVNMLNDYFDHKSSAVSDEIDAVTRNGGTSRR